MTDSAAYEECWACGTTFQNEGQKVCIACQRWQTIPWRYLNLSNAALAVVAALVSTGLTIFTLIENYQRDRHFDFFIHGRSILAANGNVNLRMQNYSRNSVVLDSRGTCTYRDDPEKSFTIVLADRWRLFPPIMSTHVDNRFFVSADTIELQRDEVYDCNIGARNENDFRTIVSFSATVT